MLWFSINGGVSIAYVLILLFSILITSVEKEAFTWDAILDALAVS